MDDRPQAPRLSGYFGLDGSAEYVSLTTDEQGISSIAAIRYGEAIGERRLDDERTRPKCERGWLVFDGADLAWKIARSPSCSWATI